MSTRASTARKCSPHLRNSSKDQPSKADPTRQHVSTGAAELIHPSVCAPAQLAPSFSTVFANVPSLNQGAYRIRCIAFMCLQSLLTSVGPLRELSAQK